MARPEPSVGRSEVGPASKWVTRARIRVNRTATAWLIRRFVDPAAIFLFVAVSLCGQESVCDLFEDLKAADGRQLIVAGDLIISKSLAALGAADCDHKYSSCIVHGADFEEEMRLVPESAGLRAISGGFPLVARDDHEILERAGFLYDALYASLKARLGAPG